MKKRIIVLGGLGNQMFLAAIYLVLKKNGYNAVLDISLYKDFNMHNGFELDKIFDRPFNLINKGWIHRKILRGILKYTPKHLITIDNNSFNLDYIYNKTPYLFGYWQSEEFFAKHTDDILSFFKFKPIDYHNETIARDMHAKDSVSLHLRRGDYVNNSTYSGICTDQYYQLAVKYIKTRIPLPHFYIFSNDIEYSKAFAENLNIKYTIVDWNQGKDSWKDMYLMSQCKNNIIANSSFSWWGAWLNREPNKLIIAPLKWDNNDSESYNKFRIPTSWIRL